MARLRFSSPVAALCVSLSVAGLVGLSTAQPLGTGSATTESSCNFGMEKDELRQSCQVPVPVGCVVAQVPGTDKPWASISKGGATTCRFSEKDTDWKTRITGSCTKCTTEHCSARFSVMFDCSGTLPPPVDHNRPRKP